MNIAPLMKTASIGTDVFWGEISPCEHLVQIYLDDSAFLDSLEGFVAGGLLAGDAVILIGTPSSFGSIRSPSDTSRCGSCGCKSSGSIFGI